MFSQCFRVSVTCHLRRYVFEIPALTGLRTRRSRFRSLRAPFLSGTCCDISDLHFGSIYEGQMPNLEAVLQQLRQERALTHSELKRLNQAISVRGSTKAVGESKG